MKKHSIALLILICISKIAIPQITFQKTFGSGPWNDFGMSVLQDTADQGYTIAGYTNSFGAGVGIYLLHTDVNGSTVWSKQYGSLSYGFSVRKTFDGGCIIAGQTYNTGVGAYIYYVVRTNNNGDTVWTKTYHNGSWPSAASGYPRDVWQTADSGFIFTGCVDATHSFGLIRTDANGNVLWTKSYGGTIGEHSYSIQQTTDGGFIISGFTNSFGAGDYDVFLVKTDGSGNIVWSKTYGTTGIEEGYSVQQTSDNGYIITGKTQADLFTPADVFLMKITSAGNILWTKTYGGINGEVGYSVQQTADGGYVLAGTTNSFGAGNMDVYLIRTDPDGDTLWTKAYGGINDDIGYSVKQTTNGGFIITGETSSFGAGGIDVYLICTDSEGYSGCNESGTNTIVDNPAFTQGSGGTILSSATSLYHTSVVVSNPGTIETTLCTTVGIPQLSNISKNISIFPNPSSAFINLNINNIYNEEVELNIYTSIGILVRSEILKQDQRQLTVGDLNSGMYILETKVKRRSEKQKLLIQR
ncbi:MAG: T9SS type A sorting domain-containing protein [Bacteroidetes bacterium]|nr:T9SS type A sorting domain-containing protein [Bacteroidota bacterium]